MPSSTRSISGTASLRQPGAVLLVSCYELGHQPIGIAQPLGFLRAAGFPAAGLDISVEDFDAARVRQARVVGVCVPMHTALRLGVRVAEAVRAANPQCHICFYGLYASLNAGYLLHHVADSVIGGEYEIPLVKLVEALDGSGSIGAIEGVSTPERIVPPLLRRMPATVPEPSREGLPALERYAHLEHDGERRVAGYVEASRGCLHRCLHCPIVPVYDGRFFLIPEGSVLEDIRRQIQGGATHITFGDPDFLNGPGHSLSIVRALHAEFSHVTFDFTAKIEHLLKRRTLFPELAERGCLFVVSAAESFSDAVLARLHKGHTRAEIATALEILRSAGIALRPSLVAFTPWTTMDDYLEMFEIVESLDLIDAVDPVQYSVRLLIPPGSALLSRSDVERFIVSVDQAGFQYRWKHPDGRMDRLHEAITAAVEEAAGTCEDPSATFDRLRALSHGVAERPLPASRGGAARARERRRPPRLTEPWFCCAEPTAQQFRPLPAKGLAEV